MMIINNLHTTSKMKEPSSSETSSEQVLKIQKKSFIRRTDISSADRLNLAIAGLSPSHREETIQQLCARYKVSTSLSKYNRMSTTLINLSKKKIKIIRCPNIRRNYPPNIRASDYFLSTNNHQFLRQNVFAHSTDDIVNTGR